MRDSLKYRRFRAPRGHGEALIVPPLDQASGLLRENREIAGPFPGCQEARRELLELAVGHTRQYRDVAAPPLNAPVVMTGHQPHLFHPGVWFKNFVLSELCRDGPSVGVHLLIDNDLCRESSIKVPQQHGDRVLLQSEPYDGSAEAVPFEEREVLEPSLFDSFGERACELIRPLSADPIVLALWPRARAARRRGARLAHCLAEARHWLEGELGLATLEAPLSAVCETRGFCRFAAELLWELPRLLELHNAALRDYRQAHHLRSRTHPVPDLSRDGPWLEAPFWIWSAAAPRRRPLYARLAEGRCELTDRERWRLTLSRSGAVDQLTDLPQQRMRLRPRALTTTMYARLVLSDLFLHGIGGAKYDELTDEIVRRMWGCTPPEFLTATATALLRPAALDRQRRQLRQLDRQLRDLRFNPQRHVDGGPAAELAAEKIDWIARRGDLALRHRQLSRLTAALQEHVEPLRRQRAQQRQRLASQLQNDVKLASREYSFCLFDRQLLPPLLLDLCRKPI